MDTVEDRRDFSYPIHHFDRSDEDEMIDQSLPHQEGNYLFDDLVLRDNPDYNSRNVDSNIKSLNQNLILKDNQSNDKFIFDQHLDNTNSYHQYSRPLLDSTEVMIDDRSVSKDNIENSFNSSMTSCFNDHYSILQSEPQTRYQLHHGRRNQHVENQFDEQLLHRYNDLSSRLSEQLIEAISGQSMDHGLSDYPTIRQQQDNKEIIISSNNDYRDHSFPNITNLELEENDQVELLNDDLPDFSNPALLAEKIVADIKQTTNSTSKVHRDSDLAANNLFEQEDNRIKKNSYYPADITNSTLFSQIIVSNHKDNKNDDIDDDKLYISKSKKATHHYLQSLISNSRKNSVKSDYNDDTDSDYYHLKQYPSENSSFSTSIKDQNSVEQRNSFSSSSNFYKSDISSSSDQLALLSDDMNTIQSSKGSLLNKKRIRELWHSSQVLNAKTKYINDLREELYLSDYSDTDNDDFRYLSLGNSSDDDRLWFHHPSQTLSSQLSYTLSTSLTDDNDYNVSKKHISDDSSSIGTHFYGYKSRYDNLNDPNYHYKLQREHSMTKTTSNPTRLERYAYTKNLIISKVVIVNYLIDN